MVQAVIERAPLRPLLLPLLPHTATVTATVAHTQTMRTLFLPDLTVYFTSYPVKQFLMFNFKSNFSPQTARTHNTHKTPILLLYPHVKIHFHLRAPSRWALKQ